MMWWWAQNAPQKTMPQSQFGSFVVVDTPVKYTAQQNLRKIVGKDGGCVKQTWTFN